MASLNPPHSAAPLASTWSRASVLALMGLANYIVFTFVALLGPFFPSFAAAKYGASPVQVGLVFALYPTAQIAVCPLASILCRRFGRVPIINVGLLLLSTSTLLFALSSSMTQFMVARVLQGGAGALVNVSAIAMVMEVSVSLARDMGLQEVLTGIGYMSGPPLAGLMYTYLDITNMFLIFSLVPLVTAVLLSLSLRCLGLSGWGREEAASPSSSTISILRDRTVILVALSLVVDAAAIGFLDPTLMRHVHLLLGLDITSTGFIFAVTPLVYCLGALAVNGVVQVMGNKSTIAAGLLVVSVSFVLMGPVPLLGLLVTFTPLSIWVLIVACLVGVGFGSALIIVPSVPLMLHAIEAPGTDMKDPTAAVYIWAWGVGDAIGPLLGGFLEDMLPQTHEVVCSSIPPQQKQQQVAWNDCLTSFPWASTLYGACVFLLWVLFTALVPSDSSAAAEAGADAVRTEENGALHSGRGKLAAEDGADGSLGYLLERHDGGRQVVLQRDSVTSLNGYHPGPTSSLLEAGVQSYHSTFGIM